MMKTVTKRNIMNVSRITMVTPTDIPVMVPLLIPCASETGSDVPVAYIECQYVNFYKTGY